MNIVLSVSSSYYFVIFSFVYIFNTFSKVLFSSVIWCDVLFLTFYLNEAVKSLSRSSRKKKSDKSVVIKKNNFQIKKTSRNSSMWATNQRANQSKQPIDQHDSERLWCFGNTQRLGHTNLSHFTQLILLPPSVLPPVVRVRVGASARACVSRIRNRWGSWAEIEKKTYKKKQQLFLIFNFVLCRPLLT